VSLEREEFSMAEALAYEELQKKCEGLLNEVDRLRHSEAALQESERKHRALFETMAQGVVYHGTDGSIISANPAAQRILGLTLDEMQGRTSTDPRWRTIHEDGSEFPGETHPAMVALRTGHEVRDVVMGVFHPRENDYRWISVHAVPEFLPGEDKPYQAYSTFNDVTERRKAEERIRLHVSHLRTLNSIASVATQSLDQQQVLEAALDRTLKELESDGGIVYLFDETRQAYVPVAHRGISQSVLQQVTGFKPGQGLSGHVAVSGRPLLVDDLAADPRNVSSAAVREGWHSYAAVPLRAIGGKVIGVMTLVAHSKGRFDPTRLDMMSDIGTQVGMAVQNALLYESALHELAERKRAEEALRDSEERFRLLVENAPDAIFVRVKDRFAFVNPTAVRLFGASSPEELLGLSVFDRLHPDFRARGAERMKRIDTEGAFPPLLETKYLRLDGTVVDVESSPVPFEYEGGRGSLVFARDISDRKRAEQESALLADTISASLNEIYLFDADTLRFKYVNTGALKNLGYSLEEMQILTPLDIKPEVTREEFQHLIDPLLRHELAVQVFETVHRRADGSLYPVEVHLQLFEQSGTRVFLAVIQDITERKRAEAERSSLETQLRQAQKMEAIGTLAGGVAHDFNNILGVIIGCTELALMDLPKETAPYRHLREVYRAGERAKDLVKQILAFSRRGEQVKRAMDPSLIVKEAVKMLRSSLPSTIQIRQDIGRDCGTILADPTHLHQVLMNLCVNAGHAMREKGGILAVNLKGADLTPGDAAALEDVSPGRYCVLTVGDNGHGMDRAILDRIFDPYFTTKGPREGTGLGLAVVHGIVKSHGGAIRVQSEPGRGSTFEVFLPRIDQPPDPWSVADPRTAPKGTERILFVDDEAALVEMMGQMLESLGYRVTATKSSREALEVFRGGPDRFDLVITDLTMPHMTGIELSRRMLEIRPDLPIILCTGFSEVMNAQNAKEIGIRELVQKPIAMMDIATAIRKALAGC
jgi:PAS domain S-box-containing protein